MTKNFRIATITPNSINRLAIFSLLSLTSAATAMAANSVVGNSPFIPDGWNAPKAKKMEAAPVIKEAVPKQIIEEAPLQLKLKGVSEGNSSADNRFYIFDEEISSGTWVKMNDASAPYLVTSYDGEFVVLSVNGKEYKIRMNSANLNAVVPTKELTSLTDPKLNRNRRYSIPVNGKRVLIRHDLDPGR